MKKRILYTDGAFRYKGNIGAWAYVIVDHMGVVRFLDGAAESGTTVNRMEMKAVIAGLERMSERYGVNCSVHVFSDSQYVVNGINRHFEVWQTNDFKRFEKDKWVDVANVDLWKRLNAARRLFRSCKFKWIKGHSDHHFNDLVDQHAKDFLRNYILEEIRDGDEEGDDRRSREPRNRLLGKRASGRTRIRTTRD